jgi:serine/threonine-protein kinase
MKIEELKKLLEPVTSVDVAVAYEAFQRQVGTNDPDLFLIFLRERGYISREAFLELHAVGVSVEITAFGGDLSPTEELPAAPPPADIPKAPPLPRDAPQPARSPSPSPSLRPPSAASAPEVMAAAQGNAPRYALLGVIGEGGMGQVHVAKDLTLRRKVALKRLKKEAVELRAIAERFVNEAQITAQLDHPNIVPVYSLEVDASGRVSYSMKLVQGRTLTRVIREAQEMCASGAPVDEEHSTAALLEHFTDLCDAMAFAHSKGVIHRDIKPENIMLGQFNELYVMDWGLARIFREPDGEGSDKAAGARPQRVGSVSLAEQGAGGAGAKDGAPGAGAKDAESKDLTSAGDVLGTPRYMSPEQANGRNNELDGRSDQYSLGLILFELCTLRKAVPGADPLSVWKNAAEGVKVPLVHISSRDAVPRELRAIIEKATAFRREDRYTTVKHLADDVRRYLRGDAVLALPDTAPQKALRAMARRRGMTALAAALIVLASVGASLTWALYQRGAAASLREVAAVEREAAVRQVQGEKEKESRFMMAVVRQSQEVNARLLSLEKAVHGLAQAAAQSLSAGAPAASPPSFAEDFADGGRAAASLVDSTLHHGKVSFKEPAWALASDADRAAVLPKLQRLASIDAAFRQSCLPKDGGGAPGLGGQILENEGAILWCYIGLAEGAVAFYPGTPEVPEGFDPRTRPWYSLSANKRGAAWGNPYIDKIRGELVLPCSASFYDPEGRFLGVAGVSITFDSIVDKLLRSGGGAAFAHPVEEAFLLDEKARIVLRSRDARKIQKGVLHDAASLEAFHLPVVVADVLEKRSGYREVSSSSGSVLVAYNRMSVLGWYYVVTAGVDAVRAL